MKDSTKEIIQISGAVSSLIAGISIFLSLGLKIINVSVFWMVTLGILGATLLMFGIAYLLLYTLLTEIDEDLQEARRNNY